MKSVVYACLKVPRTGMLLVLGLMLIALSTLGRQTEDVLLRTAPQPFDAASPWQSPLPVNPAVHPDSDAMVAHLTRDNGVYANLVEFGIPIYYANAESPRYEVPCTVTTWGPCPFDGRSVPIPDGARPHHGSDGALVVIDESADLVYEFWQAVHDGAGWTTSWAAVAPLGGSGWGEGDAGSARTGIDGAGTASGASRLGGVIRLAEISAGDIPHALALQTDNACADVFWSPATKTDGASQRPDCVPEGARLQLDPTIAIDQLDLTPGERTVARALQKYGAYIVDKAGAPLSMSFELDHNDQGALGSVYEKAGFRWDYDDMPGIPWSRLRVLAPA